jgi:hypothetical protein
MISVSDGIVNLLFIFFIYVNPKQGGIRNISKYIEVNPNPAVSSSSLESLWSSYKSNPDDEINYLNLAS